MEVVETKSINDYNLLVDQPAVTQCSPIGQGRQIQSGTQGCRNIFATKEVYLQTCRRVTKRCQSIKKKKPKHQEELARSLPGTRRHNKQRNENESGIVVGARPRDPDCVGLSEFIIERHTINVSLSLLSKPNLSSLSLNKCWYEPSSKFGSFCYDYVRNQSLLKGSVCLKIDHSTCHEQSRAHICIG